MRKDGSTDIQAPTHDLTDQYLTHAHSHITPAVAKSAVAAIAVVLLDSLNVLGFLFPVPVVAAENKKIYRSRFVHVKKF